MIGLLIFLAWWAVLLAPFRVERWTLAPGEICRRSTFFGIGFRRRCDPQELARIELRRGAGVRMTGFTPAGEEADTPYSLGFVGQDGRDRLVFDGLTEGEARWVGGLLCSPLKDRPGAAADLDPLWDRWIDRR